MWSAYSQISNRKKLTTTLKHYKVPIPNVTLKKSNGVRKHSESILRIVNKQVASKIISMWSKTPQRYQKQNLIPETRITWQSHFLKRLQSHALSKWFHGYAPSIRNKWITPN